jgi:hypothetical protein
MVSYFSAEGRDFDPDAFLERFNLPSLEETEVWRRGEPLKSKVAQKRLRRKTKPDSGFQVAVSMPGRDHWIDAQIRQSLDFLTINRRALLALARANTVERRSLRFSIIWPEDMVGITRIFPVELLQLAGSLRVEIEFSVYGAIKWKPLKADTKQKKEARGSRRVHRAHETDRETGQAKTSLRWSRMRMGGPAGPHYRD